MLLFADSRLSGDCGARPAPPGLRPSRVPLLVVNEAARVHAPPVALVTHVGLFPRVGPTLVHHQFVRTGEALATLVADVGTLESVLGSSRIQQLIMYLLYVVIALFSITFCYL